LPNPSGIRTASSSSFLAVSWVTAHMNKPRKLTR
jgi:hypothetical protein